MRLKLKVGRAGRSFSEVAGAAVLSAAFTPIWRDNWRSIRALNTLGANPQDLLAILQAMKVAGALNAELEVI